MVCLKVIKKIILLLLPLLLLLLRGFVIPVILIVPTRLTIVIIPSLIIISVAISIIVISIVIVTRSLTFLGHMSSDSAVKAGSLKPSTSLVIVTIVTLFIRAI